METVVLEFDVEGCTKEFTGVDGVFFVRRTGKYEDGPFYYWIASGRGLPLTGGMTLEAATMAVVARLARTEPIHVPRYGR